MRFHQRKSARPPLVTRFVLEDGAERPLTPEESAAERWAEAWHEAADMPSHRPAVRREQQAAAELAALVPSRAEQARLREWAREHYRDIRRATLAEQFPGSTQGVAATAGVHTPARSGFDSRPCFPSNPGGDTAA